MGVLPKELIYDKIKQIIKDFGSAAFRAKKCEFDNKNLDIIIIATGGKPIIPKILGINSSIVCIAEDILSDNIEYSNKRRNIV